MPPTVVYGANMDIYGVIGWPIKHSLSPAMHNAAFKALGINAEYRKFEVKPEELEDFLLNRKDVKGFNITVPHKVKARKILENKFHVVEALLYPHYDKMSGAVNTVKRNQEDGEYCNTDPIGFRNSLENDLKFKTEGKSALIIGCGGASRAIVADLSHCERNISKIYLYDISRQAVDSAQKYLSGVLPDWNKKIEFIDGKEMLNKIKVCQLLINASPVGMEEGDERVIIDAGFLHKDLYVYDLVYNRETRLVKDAKNKLGESHVVDGRGMLASQGAYSFSLWTGVPALKALDIMKGALNKALT